MAANRSKSSAAGVLLIVAFAIMATATVSNALLLIDGVTQTLTQLKVVGSLAGAPGLSPNLVGGVPVNLVHAPTGNILCSTVTDVVGGISFVYNPTDLLTFVPSEYVVSTAQSSLPLGFPLDGCFKAPLGPLSVVTNLIGLIFNIAQFPTQAFSFIKY